MADLGLKARTAFADVLAPVGETASPGVRVSERVDLSLAAVFARKGQDGALASALLDRFEIELPRRSERAASGDIAFLSTGPGAWLATREGGRYDFTLEMAELFAGLASVSDQTDGFAVLRLTGPRVRDVLAKGIHIDFHDSAFPVGRVAATNCSHVGVVLWRLEDASDGTPMFEIALFRSYASSFWEWLSSSAAEYGLAVASA